MNVVLTSSAVVLCLLVLYYLKYGAIYLPTDEQAIEKIVRLAQIQPGMKVVDLGSGDGRVVIALAQAGAIVHGFEINPVLVWISRYKIRKAGLSQIAKIYTKSFWHQSLVDYNVIVVFGMSHIMERLEQKFQKELKPGALVISNVFSLPHQPLFAQERGVRVYKF